MRMGERELDVGHALVAQCSTPVRSQVCGSQRRFERGKPVLGNRGQQRVLVGKVAIRRRRRDAGCAACAPCFGSFGRSARSAGTAPEGLLHHETFLWRLDQVGIRPYWRDFDALERFSRSEPRQRWWRDFSRDTGGTGFWHEVYQRGGGMEGIYLSLDQPARFGHFAPTVGRCGATHSAHQRLLRRAAG